MPIIFLAITLFIPSIAHAYIDPGTGSMLLQVLLAGILGGLFAIKRFWGRIMGVFRKSGPSADQDTTQK